MWKGNCDEAGPGPCKVFMKRPRWVMSLRTGREDFGWLDVEKGISRVCRVVSTAHFLSYSGWLFCACHLASHWLYHTEFYSPRHSRQEERTLP